MLSHKILTRQDVSRAASYYEDSADDYYAKEGEATEWQGLGAQALGLEGAVDSDRFRELLGGQVTPGEASTRSETRKDSSSRIGIDFTFSAPKSVSLQALVAGDVEIIRAHDRAVTKAMEAAEKRAQARQKVNGVTKVENTGKLVVAKFRHETSRERDPQLHTHAVIMNLTQRSDGQWRALKNDELIKMTKYLGTVYRAELAAELQKSGYNLQMGRDGMFELAHITRSQLESFSQRSAQIEERLADQGLTRQTATKEQKQQATMQTRARKVSIEREELFKEWQQRSKELGIDYSKREWAGTAEKGAQVSRDGPIQEVAADIAAKYAVRWAVKHLTERQSVMQETVLEDTALRHAMGSARAGDIQAEIRRQTDTGYLLREDPLYVQADQAVGKTAVPMTQGEHVETLVAAGMAQKDAKERVSKAIEEGVLAITDFRFTTQTALSREKSILHQEKVGRGAVPKIMSAEQARVELAETKLNRDQRESAVHILASQNRVIGVQGGAGTGKSTLLDAAEALLNKNGYNMLAIASYGSQVKALREAGTESRTLASFLKAKDKKIDANTVIVLDESGVVPTRLMDQLLKVTEKYGARIVLLGDIAQTKAIEAGRPFDQLQKNGMATSRLETIQRQKDVLLKEAVEWAAKGNTGMSLSRIANLEVIRDGDTRRSKIADDYVNLSPEDRDKTIIVSGTNEARRDINAKVRKGLELEGKGEEFDTLIRRDTTQAERRFAKYYRVGDVIQPEREYPKSGLVHGELYTILEQMPGNRLHVVNESGDSFFINPMHHAKLSVYDPQRAELAIGDKVRITRNDAALDLANGDRFTVDKLDPGFLTLRSETRTVTIPTDKPLHVDYSYASTVHSSQGLTTDRVLMDADSSSLTTAKDTFYVGISRARHEARIYTDDSSKLPKSIARDNVKLAALDLARSREGAQAAKAMQRNQGGKQISGNTVKSKGEDRGRQR